MSRNSRQLLGGLAVLVFLTLYIGIALKIADILPANRFVQFVFFVIAGVGWGVPLVPLLSWMENGKFEYRKRLR
ncbi:MAG: DUF2842 domain-containing protein [Caulobacterales bacterium]|nr:DUF2842 domain-containing protein [Caulobacterales bacterium]